MEDKIFRSLFCCWSELSGTTEKYFLQLHCCIKTVLWDPICKECWFFSAPKHTSTEIRDAKPFRLALKYSYPLFLKLCLLAGCQWWNPFGTVVWPSRVDLGFLFGRWFGFLLLLLSPQTIGCAGNAPLCL